MTVRPPTSITLVLSPRCASTSWSPPTATNLPSLIATASAVGRRRSSVVTRPLRRIKSAFSAPALALTDDPSTAYKRPATAPDLKKSLRVWLSVMASLHPAASGSSLRLQVRLHEPQPLVDAARDLREQVGRVEVA